MHSPNPDAKKQQFLFRFTPAIEKNLRAQAVKEGRSYEDQLAIYINRKIRSLFPLENHVQEKISPAVFFHSRLLAAYETGLTPQRHSRSIRDQIMGKRDDLELKNPVVPKEIKNWYAQIYGGFAKGDLAKIMRSVLLFASYRDEFLADDLRTAIQKGDLLCLRQITRCIALIHDLEFEGNGQAMNLVTRTKREIMFSYLELEELDNQPPTPTEIRVLLAYKSCAKKDTLPKISDIWDLLQIGSLDDFESESKSTCKICSLKYIKTVLLEQYWPLGTRRFHLNRDKVKMIFDRATYKYIDE